MPARRFFVSGTHHDGDRVALERGDAHKIEHVLRLESGDRISVVDSAGTSFDGTLERAGGAIYALLSGATARPQDAALEIVVAQGIPKGAKMDFIVEKLGEVGVSSVIPVVTERTVVRDPNVARVDRWRRLARSAAQQSGSARIPEISDVVPYPALVSRFGDFDRVLFPWEAADPRPLRDVLPELLPRSGRILVVIGPEGGFSHAEADAAASGGASVISLGSQILRTETAALVLSAIIRYLSAS